MADSHVLRSPRALADDLRTATPDAAADLVVAVEARLAELALVALHVAEDEDWSRSSQQRSIDAFAELLLGAACSTKPSRRGTGRCSRSP
jgi:exonuclease VII large subunit